jgi:N-acetylneuraminic acid mutarotase
MIVFGGNDGNFTYNTGGRYNPVTDTWTALPATIEKRSYHTAIWTGEVMVVAGGLFAIPSGSPQQADVQIFDPVNSTWTKWNSNGMVREAERDTHCAVWTGTQMLLWGGREGLTARTVGNSGHIYNPQDRSTILLMGSGGSVPSPRTYHSCVWTGTQLVVFGGREASGDYLNTGGRTAGTTSSTWSAIATNGPAARDRHTAVWTGSEMIVYGGTTAQSGTYASDGWRYNPSSNTWTETAPFAPGRFAHKAVWTGSEMIVWGGSDGNSVQTGGRYVP